MIFAGKFPTFMYNLLCVWQDWGLAPAVSPLHQHGGDRGQLRQVLQIFLPDNLLCDQPCVLGPLPQRALIIWLGQKLKIIIDSFSFRFALYLFLCYLL